MKDFQENFDSLMMSFLREASGHKIEAVLEAFFSFLARKTDFVTGASSTDFARQLVASKFESSIAIAIQSKNDTDEKRRKEDVERKRAEIARKEKIQHDFEKKKDSTHAKIREIVEDGETVSTEEGDSRGDNSKMVPIDNGAETNSYKWTQQLGYVEVFVDVDPSKRSRDLQVKLEKTRLSIKSKGDVDFLVNGEWDMPIKVDDSTWTLADGKIHIILEKHDNQRWWSRLLKGDVEIDTSKVMPENSKLDDLDGETRGVVEKMMYDQRMKASGLPTSEEQKQHEMLAKFKNAHPEMDFSNCKVSGSGFGGF